MWQDECKSLKRKLAETQTKKDKLKDAPNPASKTHSHTTPWNVPQEECKNLTRKLADSENSLASTKERLLTVHHDSATSLSARLSWTLSPGH